jgi:CopG family nickel-responsive transcriptional regulator
LLKTGTQGAHKNTEIVLLYQHKNQLFQKILFRIKYLFGSIGMKLHIGTIAVRRIKMKRVERIGVSLDKKLLSMFDKLIAKQGYRSRSEAIRDLIRRQISSERLGNPGTKAVAAVFVVYDHHSTKLMDKLTDLQHSHLLQTICSTHIHLDEHECLEVIVLRGRVSEINKMAENIISLKGVKLGRTNLVATEPI